MVSLDLVKSHLRIDGDFDDAYLTQLLMSANVGVEKYCDRRIVDSQAELDALDDADAILSNGLIDQAKLMLIAHWYHQREAVSAGAMNEVPMAIDFMLNPYRRKSL